MDEELYSLHEKYGKHDWRELTYASNNMRRYDWKIFYCSCGVFSEPDGSRKNPIDHEFYDHSSARTGQVWKNLVITAAKANGLAEELKEYLEFRRRCDD